MFDDVTLARFWSKVNKGHPDECWEWQAHGDRDKNGKTYGCFRIGKMQKAHRVAYQIENGPIPDGLVVRHKCDNKLCCNPSHLEVGTQKDNVADIYKRGRQNILVGERHGRSRLCDNQIRELRQRVQSGESKASVARHFGVSTYLVYYAVNKGWRHVE